MTGTITIVTDSTACLPCEISESCHIVVVPLRVVLGGEAHDETDRSALDVHAALSRGAALTTSRPAPARFARAYTDAAAAGAEGIVSVHVSSHLSGTVDSARLAAASAPVPVRVVDSRSIGAGLGFAVAASAAAARAGRPLAEVAVAAARRSSGLRSLFCVATLEHLHRGGRVGAVGARLGTTLGVKPLLHIVDGRIVPLERVRTAARAVARLEHLAAEFAARCGAAEVDLGVQHLGNGERAGHLAQRLRECIPSVRTVHISEVGPVIAAHTGPGMLGVVVAPE
ncbi:MAG: DegV family protein [Micromonosporaceae bacterium]